MAVRVNPQINPPYIHTPLRVHYHTPSTSGVILALIPPATSEAPIELTAVNWRWLPARRFLWCLIKSG